jgi:hypothetical protein
MLSHRLGIPHTPHAIGCTALLLAAFWSAFSVPVSAQTQATISGVLTDPSGAAVPDARLTLTQQDTGVVLKTDKSDGNGSFSFQAVPAPGAYSISIQANGFSRLEQKDIFLTAGERRSVGTLALAVGSTADSVTVQADVTPVQTTSAERSGTIDSHEIGALLARGLQFNGLLRGLPGIAGAVDPNSPGGAYAPYGSINGTRWSSTIPTLDGVGASDPSSQGQLMATSATDSLEEVNVKMSNFQAEYGQSGGAIINLTTKSGSRQFHGSVYQYFRNEALNANDFFNNLNNVVRPRYRYLTGGGSLGGPLYIPGKFNSARNKVFFFFNDQYYRQNNPGSLIKNTMPSVLERKGDFSQTLTVGGAQIPIFQPGTKTPYPGNVIPASQFSAYGQALLNIFPLPNFDNRAVSGGSYNFVFQEVPINNSNNYTYRVDFNLTEKFRMYGRNNQINNHSQGYAVGAAPGPNWGLVKAFYNSRIETPSISATYTFTPTLINEFTFGVNHWDEPGGPISQEENAKIQRTTYGLQNLGQWYPAANSNNVIPIMGFADVPNAAAYSYDARAPINGATTIFTIADNVTKVLGNHTLKMGINIVRTRMWKGNPGTAYSGNFQFGKDVNNPLDSNYGYSNALLGVFDTYTESSTRTGADYREGSFEEYVQDSWKVSRKLTLEMGLRFTTRLPWRQRNDIMAGFSPGAWNPAQASVLYTPGLNGTTRVAIDPITKAQLPAVYIGALVPGVGSPANGMIVVGQPGVPKGLTTSPAVDIAPRFGFAYDVTGDGKTSVRGGFGISYLPTSAPSLCCSGSYQSNPPLAYTPKTYYGTLATFLSSAGTLFPSNVLGNSDTSLASTYSFSLGVQRDIGHSVVVDVAGVGTLGRHLEMAQNLNQLPYGKRFLASSQDATVPGRPLPDAFLVPYPGLGTITFRQPVGTSSYYALQTQANRKFSKGFEFKANFTWSKSMDYGSTDGATMATYGSPRLLNYGASSFDRTFVTNISWLYEIPGFRRLNNPVLSTLLGHWNVSGIGTFESGVPSGVTFTTTSGVDLIGGGDGQRINISGDAQLPYGTRGYDRFFDTSVFSQPALGYIGSAPRNVYRGPGWNQWDLAAFKGISIREKASVQFRGELFNAFNHAQWSTINSAATFNPAGQQINALFGRATADRGPRVIQLALRVTF